MKHKALNKSLLKLKNATVKFFFLLANKKKEGDFFRFGTHERKGQKKSQKKKKEKSNVRSHDLYITKVTVINTTYNLILT